MDVKSNEHLMLRRFALGDVFRRNAGMFPDKTALIFPAPDGSVMRYSWPEFNSSINKVANALTDLGITKGDKVSIYALNCPQFLFLTYGLTKIGACIAPVNVSLTGKDARFVVENSNAKILFIEDSLIDRIGDILPDLHGIQLGFIGLSGVRAKPEGWLDFADLLDKYPDIEPVTAIDADDMATLTYTSGTESLPKGVMITHGNYYAGAMSIQSERYVAVKESDVGLQALPLFYTGGIGVATYCLMLGAQVVLLYFPEAKTIIDLIKNHKITFTCLPPTLYVRLLRVDNLKPAVKSLRRCISFGATIPKQMIEDWNAVAPHIEWISLYASSELSATGTVATFSRIDEIPEADMNWVGKPAPALEIRIVDPYGKDVPIGETGEMIFRGPTVFKGYYKNEEKNTEVFSGGWFHSGDMARMNAAGEVFYVDRIKDMVKSGGENISSSSIELVVGTHPSVSECAVFGVPHPEWMEAVAVSVIPKQGKTITEGELIDYCKSKLPRFKVPKYVIVVEELPRNPTGKILKRELKAQYKDIASQRPS